MLQHQLFSPLFKKPTKNANCSVCDKSLDYIHNARTCILHTVLKEVLIPFGESMFLIKVMLLLNKSKKVPSTKQLQISKDLHENETSSSSIASVIVINLYVGPGPSIWSQDQSSLLDDD